jgi:Flp pilus assembly pilin Flp
VRSTSPLARLRDLLRHEPGQTMPEYGVVLATVCIGCLLAFGTLSGAVVSMIQSVVDLLP